LEADKSSCKELAIEENHETACKYIRQAGADGAELAVLPEYVIPEDFQIQMLTLPF
jgi:predicted amidohydrolase